MDLSINFCGFAYFNEIFLSLSTSWWNFKKSEDKLKQWFDKVCTKPNLYSSGTKLIKLVYTPISIYFLKTLVTNLLFCQNIFQSRQERSPFISISIENFTFLWCHFLYIHEKIAHVLVYETKQKYHPIIFCNKQVWNILSNLSANYCHDNKEKY